MVYKDIWLKWVSSSLKQKLMRTNKLNTAYFGTSAVAILF